MSGCFAFNNGQKCQISFPNTLIEFLILRMSLPDLHSQDVSKNSPYCLPDNSHDVSMEN